MKGTISYPVGVTFETIEGPFEGSTYFIYYIPRGDNITNVAVAGEFKSASIDHTIGSVKSNSSSTNSK